MTALNDGFRQNGVPEEIRVRTDSERANQLWIPRAEYERDNWGELLRAVARDHQCLAVEIRNLELLTEIGLASEPVACGGGVLACSPTACP